MKLTESDIINIIKSYVQDQTVTYSILMNGEWGCGKTYFIKNKLLKSIDNGIYVSLYGINKIEDIDKKIYYAIIKEEVGNNPTLETVNKGKNIILEAYSTFSSSVEKLFKIPLPDLKSIDATNLISNFVDMSKYLIIFDDLERVNIPINEVLGYINNYVEHKNVKTIIVANEREIERLNVDTNYELKVISCINNLIDYEDKNNTYNQDKLKIYDLKQRVKKIYDTENKYNIIKEKLIGKTITYFPNLNIIIDSLIEKYRDDKKYYLFLKENKDILLEKLKIDKCNNLRTIIFILSEYKIVFEGIIDDNYGMVEDKILKLTFINMIHMSILLKNGKDINSKLNGVMYSNAVAFYNNKFQNSDEHFTAFDFITKFLCSSHLDKEKMRKCINYYIDVEITNALPEKDPYYILETYWELEDNELNDALEKIINNFHYNYRVFPKLLRKLAGIKEMNIYSDKVEKIIEMIEKNLIENKVVELNFSTMEIDMKKETLDIYNEYAKKFDNIIIENRINTHSDKIMNALLSDSWGENLYELYIKNNVIYGGGFLKNINIHTLIQKIDESDTKNIFYFKYTIDKIYGISNIDEFYSIDKENLESLINQLKKLNHNNYCKTKKYALKVLLEVLIEKLRILL